MHHASTTYNVFVYGTLRRAGEYHHLYLRYSSCVHNHYRLPHYALYDYQGQYPFMIPERGSSVIGEVYQISEAVKSALDEFEDVHERLYKFVYLPEHQFHTYVKSDLYVGNLPCVPHGDWLTYCSAR